MRTRIFFFAAATSLVLLILLAGGALGQGTYQAQIRGVVSDPTGAVVGNATVTITENVTNLTTTAKTGSDGYYILRGLRPSTYSVKAEAPGFQTLEKQSVVLAVDQQTTDYPRFLPQASGDEHADPSRSRRTLARHRERITGHRRH